MSLTRWPPFRDLMSAQDDMDRITWWPFGRRWESDSSSLMVPMDMAETDNEIVISASLPGVKPGDVDITVTGNTLTIKGESKAEEETERGNAYFRERRFGSFRRSIALPADVDAEQAEASFENGVLKLKIPKKEEAKPKQISIKADAQSKR